ncbi:MAG: DUF2141 domain-containing protein [Phycisphaerales bacterium]|nr:DUF2141 domain-containing protein [Phycisphaerales bacterium]
MFCPPMLPPMEADITQVQEVSVVSAMEVNETRIVKADYRDNRTSVEDRYWTTGTVQLTNPSSERRWLAYQWRVALPEGTYLSDDERLCLDGNTAVFAVRRIVRPGEQVEVHWDIEAGREQFGDLNNDGRIDGEDLGRMLEGWGVSWGPADLGRLLANWTVS